MSNNWIRLLMGVVCGLCLVWSMEAGDSPGATILAFSAGLLFAALIATLEDEAAG